MKTQKGFTLIELMIVIVILGTLMATVVPKLTGAQARSRDTARMADLGNISAALSTYFADSGQYPGTNGTKECLDPATAAVTDTSYLLKGYLKGNKVPSDPLKTAAIGATPECSNGQYYYAPIAKNGVNNSSYLLCANSETFQKANVANFTSDIVANIGAYATLAGKIGTALTAEATNANDSVYCIIGE